MSIDLTHNTPINFWLYVSMVTTFLALGMLAILQLTDVGLLRIMLTGALLVVAAWAYSPSTLDMTGWTMTVMCMFPLGLIMLIGTPIIYALFVTFVGHIEVTR